MHSMTRNVLCAVPNLMAPLLIAITGCSGNGGRGDNGEVSAALGSCHWPASLSAPANASPPPSDSPWASWGQCSAVRAYLSCTTSSGAGAGCPSNDPTQASCPGIPSFSGGSSNGDASTSETASTFVCLDVCQPTEYLVACGPGPGPSPGPNSAIPVTGPKAGANPPAGCRALGATPASLNTLCCLCGS